MAKLIKNGRIVSDDWQIVLLGDDEHAADLALPAGKLLVPLAVWQAQREAIEARANEIAVWLDGSEDPAEIAGDLAVLPLVAIRFPKFTDGRGYSSAALLRTRYGYTGELRAIGDVLRDQFQAFKRCGFDALQPAEGRYTDEQLERALASLEDFSAPYQGSVIEAEPLFRRQQRGIAA